MPHSIRALFLPFLALVILLAYTQASASAGNLAATARGIDHKSSSDNKSSSSDDKSKSDDDDDRSSFFNSDNSNYSACLLCDGSDASIDMSQLPRPNFDLRLVAQKVLDSDGSYHFDASMNIGRVGFFAAVDHYFEKIQSTGKMAERSEDVRINLFELSAFARLIDHNVFQADLRVGFAGATSSHFDSLPGGILGLRLRAHASPVFSFSAEAKAMRYSHEIAAVEAAAGAHISIAYLGYRALKFDVGPVLEGPEAGLSFQF